MTVSIKGKHNFPGKTPVVAMRGEKKLSAKALFKKIFPDGLIDVRKLNIEGKYWSPAGELTSATRMCTIGQFAEFLRSAPTKWVKSNAPDGQRMIVAARQNAKMDGVVKAEIEKAVMTSVSFTLWAKIGELLRMKVYFSGARCYNHPAHLRNGCNHFPESRNSYVGAGFAE